MKEILQPFADYLDEGKQLRKDTFERLAEWISLKEESKNGKGLVESNLMRIRPSTFDETELYRLSNWVIKTTNLSSLGGRGCLRNTEFNGHNVMELTFEENLSLKQRESYDIFYHRFIYYPKIGIVLWGVDRSQSRWEQKPKNGVSDNYLKKVSRTDLREKAIDFLFSFVTEWEKWEQKREEGHGIVG